MGVEYRLIKPVTGEAYDLGKHAHRPPQLDTLEKKKKATTFFTAVALYREQNELLFPSERAMWRICTDGYDCEIVKLSERWTLPEGLAELINIAIFDEDDDRALVIARDILEWAADDDVIIIPDTLDYQEIANRLGVKIRNPKIVRTVYEIFEV